MKACFACMMTMTKTKTKTRFASTNSDKRYENSLWLYENTKQYEELLFS